MAKVSFVPFDQEFYDLFSFCGVTLNISTYGDQQGWDAAAFQAALTQCEDYLNDNLTDENVDEFDNWFNVLQDEYTVAYWSAEYPVGP